MVGFDDYTNRSQPNLGRLVETDGQVVAVRRSIFAHHGHCHGEYVRQGVRSRVRPLCHRGSGRLFQLGATGSTERMDSVRDRPLAQTRRKRDDSFKHTRRFRAHNGDTTIRRATTPRTCHRFTGTHVPRRQDCVGHAVARRVRHRASVSTQNTNQLVRLHRPVQTLCGPVDVHRIRFSIALRRVSPRTTRLVLELFPRLDDHRGSERSFARHHFERSEGEIGVVVCTRNPNGSEKPRTSATPSKRW